MAAALLIGLSLAAAEAEADGARVKGEKKDKAGEKRQRQPRFPESLMTEDEATAFRKLNVDFRKAVKEAKEDKEAVKKAATTMVESRIAALEKLKTRLEADKNADAKDVTRLTKYIENLKKNKDKMVERMTNPPKRGEKGGHGPGNRRGPRK